jgi:hypothetical protein
VASVRVLDNPAKFSDPFRFEIAVYSPRLLEDGECVRERA